MRQVLRAGALGRPRGMGWGGRWEGGSGWGTHVNPWLIHVYVWQKPLKYCKLISLQLIKINGKKSTIPVLYKHPFRAQSRRKQICHEKKVKVKESEVAQSCPTLCDPVGCSPPGSSVHRIFQARILEWVAISFPKGSSWSRD